MRTAKGYGLLDFLSLNFLILELSMSPATQRIMVKTVTNKNANTPIKIKSVLEWLDRSGNITKMNNHMNSKQNNTNASDCRNEIK
jgi:hypothetical protein